MTEIIFAVVLIWLTGDASQPPFVVSVQFPDRATCEAGKALAMASAVAVEESDGYDRNVMRGVVVCSHVKIPVPS